MQADSKKLVSKLVCDELLATTEVLFARARDASVFLTCAESCTGGLLAAALIHHAGASRVIGQSFVVYSNHAKMDLLGVSRDLLITHGAVSEEVAKAMAAGARARARKADAVLAMAITGIAGPDGASPDKPVGLVHLAVDGPGGVQSQALRLGAIGRTPTRLQSAIAAAQMASAQLATLAAKPA